MVRLAASSISLIALRPPDAIIDFDVHHLVQQRDGGPKVFGWIAGDEQALLRERGIT